MEKRTFATEGIILARRNYGEADRILTIFSKHYGKISALARGIRRPISRKRGALELFNWVRILVASGKAFDIVAEAEVKQTFSSWRKDLTRVGVAYHLAEVVNKLTREHQEHRQVFELLVDSFTNLHLIPKEQLAVFIQTFKIRVLEELGFLERGAPVQRNLDFYIEDLAGGRLKTRRFLTRVSK